MKLKTADFTLIIVTLATFAGILFAVNMSIGAILTYVTGTQGASGIVTGFFTGFIISLAALIVPIRHGGPFIFPIMLLFGGYCVIAWPTVLMGPPGPYKIAVGIAAGAAYDLCARFLPNRIRLHIAWVLFTIILLAGTLLFFHLLEFDGIVAFKKAVWFLFAIFTIEGLCMVFVATWLFKKRLKNQPVALRVHNALIEAGQSD